MRPLSGATVAGCFFVALSGPSAVAEYVPFGFQTGARPSRSGESPSDVGNDDSYAGSAFYDPDLHSLYVSGGTYGNYFDRHMRGSPTHDAHLGESDCFLAALRLPHLPKGGDEGGGGNASFLRWAEEGPIPHTWRYGADSTYTASGVGVVSSYAAMDRLVEHFVLDERRRFDSLERVVVVGHSAGGQFVQRWALTSLSPAWMAAAAPPVSGLTPLRTNRRMSGTTGRVRASATIRAVVANPRSFAYLTPARYVDGDGSGDGAFRVPDPSSIESCPTYDAWEWGLEPGGHLPTPYKDDAMKRAGGVEALIENYAGRDVVYLAGQEDREEVKAGCEDDDFQGKTRFERSEFFHRSLAVVYGGRTPHARMVVEGVGHDHSLMYQSPEGLEALFGV